MQANTRPSFAFLVVTYNHQDYILQHLESIKYLVLSYGAGIDVDVIINDDCSRDKTCTLVDKWLQLNAALFRSAKTIYNPFNLGTCASVNNMLKQMVADHCKLTAGDDVYSFENIFDLTQHELDVAMTSGRALFLIDDVLRVDRLSNSLATATQVIYQNDSLLHRFKHFSYNNAPNLFYASECLLHPTVRAFLERFDVVEDWPLQVAIARQFPERSFKLIDQVLVYYRRTAGSTYIVANQRFVKDKIQMYDSLILNERNSIERLRLNSRKFCFKTQNRWINRIFNLDLYFFAASCIAQLYRILKKTKTTNMRLTQHQLHYARIKAAAQINSTIINHQQRVEKLEDQ